MAMHLFPPEIGVAIHPVIFWQLHKPPKSKKQHTDQSSLHLHPSARVAPAGSSALAAASLPNPCSCSSSPSSVSGHKRKRYSEGTETSISKPRLMLALRPKLTLKFGGLVQSLTTLFFPMGRPSQCLTQVSAEDAPAVLKRTSL